MRQENDRSVNHEIKDLEVMLGEEVDDLQNAVTTALNITASQKMKSKDDLRASKRTTSHAQQIMLEHGFS